MVGCKSCKLTRKCRFKRACKTRLAFFFQSFWTYFYVLTSELTLYSNRRSMVYVAVTLDVFGHFDISFLRQFFVKRFDANIIDKSRTDIFSENLDVLA